MRRRKRYAFVCVFSSHSQSTTRKRKYMYMWARARATDSRCARRAQLSSYKWFSIIPFLDFSFSLSLPPPSSFASRGWTSAGVWDTKEIAVRRLHFVSINIRVAADRAISFSISSLVSFSFTSSLVRTRKRRGIRREMYIGTRRDSSDRRIIPAGYVFLQRSLLFWWIWYFASKPAVSRDRKKKKNEAREERYVEMR